MVEEPSTDKTEEILKEIKLEQLKNITEDYLNVSIISERKNGCCYFLFRSLTEEYSIDYRSVYKYTTNKSGKLRNDIKLIVFNGQERLFLSSEGTQILLKKYKPNELNIFSSWLENVLFLESPFSNDLKELIIKYEKEIESLKNNNKKLSLLLSRNNYQTHV